MLLRRPAEFGYVIAEQQTNVTLWGGTERTEQSKEKADSRPKGVVNGAEQVRLHECPESMKGSQAGSGKGSVGGLVTKSDGLALILWLAIRLMPSKPSGSGLMKRCTLGS